MGDSGPVPLLPETRVAQHEFDFIARNGRKLRSFWRLPNAVWWVARIGTAGYPPRIRRRLAVTNIIAAMVSLMTIPYVLLYVAYDWYGLLPAIIAFSPQVIFYALTPYFHRYGPISGALYLCTIWLIFGIGYCMFFGRDSGLHFYFFCPARRLPCSFSGQSGYCFPPLSPLSDWLPSLRPKSSSWRRSTSSGSSRFF
jgi:hypothetical protein